MSVLCSSCGEELIGAVNRCWKCGKLIVSHSGPLGIPPIRRSPVVGPLNAPVEALVLEAPEPATSPVPTRRGSPFERGAAILHVAGARIAPPSSPAPANRIVSDSSGQVARLASAAAMALTFLSWALSYSVPIATLCLAVFAIGLGIRGLFGPDRRIAIFALSLACGALAWGAFATLVQIYKMIYGVHPFASAGFPFIL